MDELILYLDPVNEASRAFIKGLAPSGFEVCFARPDGKFLEGIYSLDVRYLLVASAKVTKDIMLGCKDLKLIQKTGAGTENIDKEAAASLKIPVAATPGANSDAVAELVILYILVLYRNLIELDRATKNGSWLMWEKRHQCFELKGKEVGLIGFGSIGRALNRRLQGFEARVSYYDIKRLDQNEEKALGIQFKVLKDILAYSDVISLHLPLNASTRNLIGKRQLEIVKRGCILINTSRGAVIDEAALIDALECGKLAGAALDTYEHEPIKADNPLLKFKNVITTPHVGAGTIDTWKTVLLEAFDNIKRVSEGSLPRNVVNEVF